MKLKYLLSLLFISSLIFSAQDDTVKVYLANTPPVIDGLINDSCWTTTNWQSIDQTWINYGESIPAEDFSGRFKILWSNDENLLYVCVEVTDDVIVDGWPDVPGDYYDFDIVEVFLDPDKSGGLHVFDGTGSTGQQWGTNAENAFSYHVNMNFPLDNGVTTECIVNDIAGTDWNNMWHPNYAKHFPEIALREVNNKYYWEFSLKVYNDNYDDSKPENSRKILKPNDIIGFSMAYCDNDDLNESPKKRDNFFGSVWVPEEAYNDHWMNADGFGTIQLMDNIVDIKDDESKINSFTLNQNYPNPFNPTTNISFSLAAKSFVNLTVFNSLGQKVKVLINNELSSGMHSVQFNSDENSISLASGIYYYRLSADENFEVKKMILLQ